MTYSEKLKDPRWQRCRLKVLERAGWKCENCGGDNLTLHVHHGYYRKGADPWDYEDVDLHCLCCKCHETVQFVLSGIYELLGKLPPRKLPYVWDFLHEIESHDGQELWALFNARGEGGEMFFDAPKVSAQ